VEEDVVVVLENEEEVRGRVQVRLYGTPRDRVMDAYGSHVIIFIVFLLSVILGSFKHAINRIIICPINLFIKSFFARKLD